MRNFELQQRILKRISHLNVARSRRSGFAHRCLSPWCVVGRGQSGKNEGSFRIASSETPGFINARHDDTHETTFRDSAQCAMASALRPQPTSLPAPSAERPPRRDERCDRCILGLELVE